MSFGEAGSPASFMGPAVTSRMTDSPTTVAVACVRACACVCTSAGGQEGMANSAGHSP